MTIKPKPGLGFLLEVGVETSFEELEEHNKMIHEKVEQNIEEFVARPLRDIYEHIEMLVRQVQISGMVIAQDISVARKPELLIAQADALWVCNDALASVREARAHVAVLKKLIHSFNTVSAAASTENLAAAKEIRARLEEAKAAADKNRAPADKAN